MLNAFVLDQRSLAYLQMPGSKRGHSQGTWDVSALKRAVSAVNLSEMSLKSAAKQRGIPCETLSCNLKLRL